MFKIDKINIGVKYKPFIIAEMSGNHNQSLDKALEIVQAAADSGADAIKLQTYTADTITLDVKDGDFYINDEESLWYGKSLHDLYDIAHTPWDWHKPIMEKARSLGLLCFSSPFDESAVDFLEDLEVPAYKIASFENSHLPLIRKVVRTGKPIIISTGLSTLSQISETVSLVKEAGCKNYALLKCTSSYPSNPENSNVKTIPHMRDTFNCEIGLSDHTLGIGAALAAVSFGATIIEKHFTMDRSDGGVDSEFSLTPSELQSLVVESKRAWQSLGRVTYGPIKSEISSLIFRRSIYISRNMKKGEEFSVENIRIVRPGHGLEPKYYEILLGKKINQDAKKGTAVTWNMIS